jgi:DNA-binding NtrC family response regulator
MRPPADSLRVAGPIMDALIDYNWPGNVRELRNVLQRYATLGQLEFLSPGQQAPPTAGTAPLDLRQAVQQLEKDLISRALREAGGNRTKAAELLGISRRALFRKLPSP